VQLVLGDFNARVGVAAAGDPYLGCCVGRHGVGKRNAPGERLLELCAATNLCVANTFFQHKSAHSFTWVSPDGRTQAAMDFALVGRRRLSSVANVRAHRHGNLLAPAAGSVSDHHLVVTTLQLRLKVRPQQQRQHRLEMALQRDPGSPAAVRYALTCDAQAQRRQQQQQLQPASPGFDAALQRLFDDAAAAADASDTAHQVSSPPTPVRSQLSASGSLDAELGARIKKAANAWRLLQPTPRLRSPGLLAKAQMAAHM
jgi:hypothetical protein